MSNSRRKTRTERQLISDIRKSFELNKCKCNECSNCSYNSDSADCIIKYLIELAGYVYEKIQEELRDEDNGE